MKKTEETQSPRSPRASDFSDPRQQECPIFHNPFMEAFRAREVLARLTRKEE